MKWNKFRDLQVQYPFLVHDLSWRGVLRDIKEFVRTKVGFIAFRPFQTLDLQSKRSSSSTPLKSKYSHARMESYKQVEYQLSFHVEGEDQNTRLGYVTTDVGDGSIQAHIDDISTWFEGCGAFIGKELVWERVIKRTVSGSSHVGLSTMSLEIYLFPKYYRFRSIPSTPQVPADPARTAYITGALMPPIIPRTLADA